MISYYKNRFINLNQTEINLNILRGIGIFETVRFINGKCIFFDDHMNRLFSYNNFFDFNGLDKKQIFDIATETINKNNLKDGLAKIVFVPKNDFSKLEFYIIIRKVPKLKSDSVKIDYFSEIKYPVLRFNPGFKSLFYFGNFLAIKDAKSKNIFEPIFYNKDNIITGGAIKNIFFIKNNSVYTPNLDLGILNGITRFKIINILKENKFKIFESKIEYSDVNNMDEAFLTSSTYGILPCYWGNWQSNYKITKELKNHYNQILKMEYI